MKTRFFVQRYYYLLALVFILAVLLSLYLWEKESLLWIKISMLVISVICLFLLSFFDDDRKLSSSDISEIEELIKEIPISFDRDFLSEAVKIRNSEKLLSFAKYHARVFFEEDYPSNLVKIAVEQYFLHEESIFLLEKKVEEYKTTKKF